MGFFNSFADKVLGIDPPKRIKLPPVVPAAPLPKWETPDAIVKRLRSKGKRGRSSTLLAGELVPKDVGKRTLLG